MIRDNKREIFHLFSKYCAMVFYRIWRINSSLTVNRALISSANKRIESFFKGEGEITKSEHRACVDAIKCQADELVVHEFSLLGTKICTGKEINWQRDYKSNYTWEPIFYKDIDYRDYAKKYDIKVPWELSRFQHLVTLGQAYQFTSEEKYAKEFISQVTDWIDKNPIGYGVNWVCTMEVAIRVINWIRAYFLFAGSALLTNDFVVKFLKSLYMHGIHIRNNLEWNSGKTTNHYLADIVGLVFLGSFFSDTREGRKWSKFGTSELEKEMDKQVYQDGVDFEASTFYHRLALELFTLAGLLCRVNNLPLSTKFWQKLEKMFCFTLASLKANGKVPQIGDNDNGSLLSSPERDILDHTYLLSIGAILFENPDFKVKEFSFAPEVLWLFGKKEYEANKNLSSSSIYSLKSKDFNDAGFYIMRNKGDYLIISAGPNGQNGNGGHCHNDKLSFELYFDGTDIIVDPGTYVYTGDYKMRNLFRSTAYHNTITVDNDEQNRFKEKELFRMTEDSKIKLNKWETNDAYDFFDAEHTGYKRLDDPVSHRRQIYFHKKDRFWVIRDILTCNAIHKFKQYFHFASVSLKDAKNIEQKKIDSFIKKFSQTTQIEGFDINPGLGVEIDLGDANFVLVPLITDNLEREIFDGWISPSYGVKQKAPIVKFSKTIKGTAEFLTVMWHVDISG